MIVRDALRAAGIEDRDARILLAHAWGVARSEITLRMTDTLPEPVLAAFQKSCVARADGKPVSRLIGSRAFWKDVFIVTTDVLDPRPETEVLVERAASEPFERVLDLGTGSGCILLSLLREHMATGVGSDVSKAALNVAQRNAEALDLADRVTWRLSNWFEQIEGAFDLIVSNPPYIAQSEMPTLSPEVRLHDPQIALTPGGDGLDAYRRITEGAGAHLAANGRLMVEIGPTQGAAVRDMMRLQGFEDIEIAPDLDGRDRIVWGRKSGGGA